MYILTPHAHKVLNNIICTHENIHKIYNIIYNIHIQYVHIHYAYMNIYP